MYCNYKDKNNVHIIKRRKNNITKIVTQSTLLDYDILLYFCKKYSEIIGKKFCCERIKYIDQNIVKFQHPYMKQSLKQFLCSKRKLTEETENLLNEYINTEGTLLNDLLKMNPSVKNSIVCMYFGDKMDPNNYFSYKGKYYLLDIENFYFKLYNGGGKEISIDCINLCKYNIKQKYDGYVIL